MNASKKLAAAIREAKECYAKHDREYYVVVDNAAVQEAEPNHPFVVTTEEGLWNYHDGCPILFSIGL